MSLIKVEHLKPLKIVINSGNGAAGPIIDTLEERLQNNGVTATFKKLQHSPDPTFPNGIPNPLLEENRNSTSEFVRSEKADFGIAFDVTDRFFL